MPLDLEKLGKVLALAGSDKEGEALAALRKADGMLKAAGMDFTGLAEWLKASAAPPTDYDADFWEDVAKHAAKQPQKPTGYTADGYVWESKEVYEEAVAREKAVREAERRRYQPARDAVIKKYGSAAAGFVRDEREQLLHDAAAPWLDGPFVPDAPDELDLAGRWHVSMGGWERYDFHKHPHDDCRRAIEAAYPMPQTIREARDEARYWEERNRELSLLLEIYGEEQLDLPAAYRRERVRRLYETELPIVTMEDLHIRLQLVASDDTSLSSAEKAFPSILDAFERLVINGASNASPEGIPEEPSKLDVVQSGHPTGAGPSMMSWVRYLITQLPGAEGDIDSPRGSALYILNEMRPKMIELLDHVRDQDEAAAEQMAALFGMPVDPVAGLTGDQLHAAIQEARITKAELRKLLGKMAELKLRAAAGPSSLSLQDADRLRPLLERLGLWRHEPVPMEGQCESSPTHQAPGAGLATATARREEVLRLLSNPDTAALSDRELARRVGVSPTTVGALRKRAAA